jgi:cytochrome b561
MHEALVEGQYSPLSKWIHWLVALIVIPLVFGSFYLEDVTKLYKANMIGLHKSLGLFVLLLMIARVISLFVIKRPALPNTIPKWEWLLSRLVQYALYVCLILMPLSGWIMSTAAGKSPNFFWLVVIPFPSIVPDKALSDFMFQTHHMLAYIIIGLLILHVAGALKHLLIDKDSVMESMLPSSPSEK